MQQMWLEMVKGDTKGSFESEQQKFHLRQVILMCAGWFSELNKYFDKTIKILAREAAAGIDRKSVPSLVNIDRKGGAFPIMLQ